jgi:hypothetical protein
MRARSSGLPVPARGRRLAHQTGRRLTPLSLPPSVRPRHHRLRVRSLIPAPPSRPDMNAISTSYRPGSKRAADTANAAGQSQNAALCTTITAERQRLKPTRTAAVCAFSLTSLSLREWPAAGARQRLNGGQVAGRPDRGIARRELIRTRAGLRARGDQDPFPGRPYCIGERADVVGAVVPPAVDEERRGARDAAQVGGVHVCGDLGFPGVIAQVAGEPLGVQAELGRVPDQVFAVSASWRSSSWSCISQKLPCRAAASAPSAASSACGCTSVSGRCRHT